MSSSTNYKPEKIVTGYPVPVNPVTPTRYNPNIPDTPQPLGCYDYVALVFGFFLFSTLIVAPIFFVVTAPVPKDPDVRVDSVLIPGFNASSQVTVDFVVGNPNKNIMYDSDFVFDPFSVSISSQNDFLGGTMIAPFSLGNGTETRISVNIVVLGTVLNDVYGHSFGGQNLGEVSFDFKLKSELHYADSERVGEFEASSEDVLVKFTPDTRVGTLSGVPKKCEVYWG